MKRFEHLGLWTMIRDTESTTDGSAQSEAVIEEFATELYDYCENENNLTERMRTLQFVLVEFKIALDHPSCGDNLSAIIKKAMLLTENELEILKMERDYKKQSVTPCGPDVLVRWNGSVAELIELMIPLQISGKLAKPTGQAMTWADVVKHVEAVYGVAVPGSYDRKTKILNRYKKTPFLDNMRQVFVEEAKKFDL